MISIFLNITIITATWAIEIVKTIFNRSTIFNGSTSERTIENVR